MRYRYALAALLMLSSHPLTQAARPIEIGPENGTRIAVSAGTGNFRVGNAVAVRVITLYRSLPMGIAELRVLSCEGSWITDSFQWAFKEGDGIDLMDVESHGVRTDDQVPLGPVRLVSIPETKDRAIPLLMKRSGQICKTAAREPKNSLIPIASFSEGSDQGAVIAIVTGTHARRGNTIDVWIRTSWYKKVPIVGADGKPLEHEGEVQKRKEATGKYALTRTAFDCKNSQTGSYEEVIYQSGNSTPTSTSIPRERLKLSGVVPNSVGEAQLEWVCRLYDDRVKD